MREREGWRDGVSVCEREMGERERERERGREKNVGSIIKQRVLSRFNYTPGLI